MQLKELLNLYPFRMSQIVGMASKGYFGIKAISSEDPMGIPFGNSNNGVDESVCLERTPESKARSGYALAELPSQQCLHVFIPGRADSNYMGKPISIAPLPGKGRSHERDSDQADGSDSKFLTHRRYTSFLCGKDYHARSIWERPCPRNSVANPSSRSVPRHSINEAIFSTVFQLRAVPEAPSLRSIMALVSFERPMPSG